MNIDNIINDDRSIRDKIILTSDQTKGSQSRKVFISDRLRKQLVAYVKKHRSKMPEQAFIVHNAEEKNAFTANVMCLLFKQIYEACRIENASSHSGLERLETDFQLFGEIGGRMAGRQAAFAVDPLFGDQVQSAQFGNLAIGRAAAGQVHVDQIIRRHMLLGGGAGNNRLEKQALMPVKIKQAMLSFQSVEHGKKFLRAFQCHCFDQTCFYEVHY